MRGKIVAANWKMNTSIAEGEKLVKEVLAQAGEAATRASVIFIPPFTHLHALSGLTGPHAHLGAQNCAAYENGAYTGEISARMLGEMGISHVVIGHSERRALFAEDHATLQRKTDLALAQHLTVIFCCGETLEQRESGQHLATVESQIKDSLFHLPAEKLGAIILAYEPVWAIGTGKTASPAQAQEMHAFIRNLIAGKYGQEIADRLPILYGGSVKASNAGELFSQPDIDGGLVGGASLQAAEFAAIIQAAG